MIKIKYIWGGKESDITGRKINKECANMKEVERYRSRVKHMLKHCHDIDTEIYFIYEKR